MRKTVIPRSVPSTMPSSADPSDHHFSSAAILPALAGFFAVFVFISSIAGFFRVDVVTTPDQGASIGSAVIVTPEAATALHIGQWISFAPPDNSASDTIRRVSVIRHALGHTVVTAGKLELVVPRNIWTAKLSIPLVGWLVAAARIAVVQVLILLLVAAVVASIVRSLILRRQG